jgi:general secretion pathway protein D
VRSRVVVNAASNTLIIQGSPTEYQQWFGLLQELDRPARTALVSVTVAEVALDNTETLGFKWLLDQFRIGGFNINLESKTSTGQAAGLVAQINSRTSSTNALLNALAVASKARILANPSILARNGETASIQVGQDVPIITQQQQATNGTGVPGGGSSANVLQTIQYRNAGVILNVKPVIHSGGRIDLDVSQEVSAVVATDLGVQTTPTFSSRKLTTKLSVADGTTVLLGGLMREDNTLSDSGIPLLKDIPLLGHVFKSSTDKRIRTELVVLVTPYVINDEFEARAITEAFRRNFSWDSSTPLQQLRPSHSGTTLRPPDGVRPNEATTSKPYVLPPADVPGTREPPLDRPDVGKQQQSARDFPASPGTRSSGALDSSANVPTQAGVPAAPASGVPPRQPRNTPASGAGKPVEDPQLLKELMDAVNRKR